MVPVVPLLANPVAAPINPGNLAITRDDLQKLREIYGDGGWGKQQAAAKSEPASDLFKVQTKAIKPKKGETVIERISGSVPLELYKKGWKADVSVTKPDGKREAQKAAVGSDGRFEYLFRVTDGTKDGKYQIVISYFGKEVKKMVYLVSR
jgi:hypothetical protein